MLIKQIIYKIEAKLNQPGDNDDGKIAFSIKGAITNKLIQSHVRRTYLNAGWKEITFKTNDDDQFVLPNHTYITLLT